MTKVRPCKRSVSSGAGKVLDDCPYPAMKGKQSCTWHWLMKQSADVQRQHAEARAVCRAEEHPDDGYRARVPASEWPPGERWCAGCQSFVPLFYTTGSRCKSCSSSAAHGRRVEETYGITPERYDELLKQQVGRCAICRSLPRTMRLAVDHDHKTGAPRGLLCKRCNHDLLGAAHDSLELLWAAMAYLLYPTASYPDRSVIDDEAIWLGLQARLALGPTNTVLAPEDDVPAPF